MKRIKQILLVTTILLYNANATAQSFTIDSICYNITSTNDKTIEVTGVYNGKRIVNIPSSVTYDGTLYDVTSIENAAFRYYNNNEITSVTIPNSIKKIGKQAFYGCDVLTSITFSNSVISIGSYAFYNCNSLTAVHITNLSAWCRTTFNGYHSNPLEYASLYLNGEKVTNLVIPNDITEIKNYAFHGCTGLTSVTIPESVEEIETDAFSGCTGITEIYSMAEVPAVIAENSFSNYSATLYVPYGAKRLYKITEGWSNFTNIVEMEPVEDDSLAGDVNGDGYINVADITTLVGIILNGAE